MEDSLVARASAAASSIALSLGLEVHDVVVVQNSNTLALRLLPCDTFARTAPTGHEVASREVLLAESLIAVAAPIASLDPRMEPRAYEHDGFTVTFWTYYELAANPGSPVEYAGALERLHTAMREVQVEAPHFTDRVAEAERLLTHRDETPALPAIDRLLLLDTLHAADHAIGQRAAAEQLLHGEPHAGNLLSTRQGMLFIDLETCCRGPIEFDLAHAPEQVSIHYPDADRALLQECRRLVLAMVAAWRWDVRDEFPNGRRHAVRILGLLRDGPPWPALGALSSK